MESSSQYGSRMNIARNIVNQIGDLWSERIPSPRWVPVRQATNDAVDEWVASMLPSPPTLDYDVDDTIRDAAFLAEVFPNSKVQEVLDRSIAIMRNYQDYEEHMYERISPRGPAFLPVLELALDRLPFLYENPDTGEERSASKHRHPGQVWTFSPRPEYEQDIAFYPESVRKQAVS